jgi:shikimate kinase
MPPVPPTLEAADPPAATPAAEPPPLRRTVVLVGLMGAGKSAVGRRLAKALGAPFADADEEIVAAAGMTIPDIFAAYGEAEFRELERRVVARLLAGRPAVLALGGGAFIDPQTRARVKAGGCSVWLRADLDTLVARTARKKGTRPLLLQGEPRQILAGLLERRYPIYAEADHIIDTAEQPPEHVVDAIVEILRREAGEAG